ncbi:hypothetical protein VNO78_23594 [Psophocarpus tetragonolobus]|uniref:histone deacetylase n=1 Tax=Psophocarpus tetragonolobus TaxID=3891 RepID=A0AAN9XE05_PSOTE
MAETEAAVGGAAIRAAVLHYGKTFQNFNSTSLASHVVSVRGIVPNNFVSGKRPRSSEQCRLRRATSSSRTVASSQIVKGLKLKLNNSLKQLAVALPLRLPVARAGRNAVDGDCWVEGRDVAVTTRANGCMQRPCDNDDNGNGDNKSHINPTLFTDPSSSRLPLSLPSLFQPLPSLSGALKTNRLTSGEAENSLHKQASQAPARDNSHSDANDAVSGPAAPAKRARLQKELTFQDMYQNDGAFDDNDEEDDSDWEPFQLHKCVEIEIKKWFCKNCTMANLDYNDCCYICGEHRDSKILSCGFFASPLAQDEDLMEVQGNVNGLKDVGSQESVANSSTAIGFDERMLLHAEVEKKSTLHPERPDRLRAIAASLARAGIFPGKCYSIPAREITPEELITVHSLEHIESVEVTTESLSSYFTSDTYANQHSALAARLAAGLCADLASAIVSGRAKNGFALVRPPGHHAGVKQAMGFCLHNNAAVAALAAQAAGARKVLILDWDVHHGNGTQEIFEQNKSVLYISLHRHEGGKFYPGTGAAEEVGSVGAEGYCVNIPWRCGGVGDNDYIFAFQHVVLPIASEFNPDFTIVSAGFDAARGDPLGCCDITPSGYAHMTHMLNALSGGKLLVILEGGYNLRSISSSATSVIKVLLGESPGCELENSFPSKAALLTVLEVLKIQMNFWPSLGPIFVNLESQWRMYCFEKKRKTIKKRRHVLIPVWRWGRKSLLFHYLNGHLDVTAPLSRANKEVLALEDLNLLNLYCFATVANGSKQIVVYLVWIPLHELNFI